MATERHVGRRTNSTDKQIKAQKKNVLEAIKERNAAKQAYENSLDAVAAAANEAMEHAPVAEVGEWIGVTRQMIYKLVRERVNGQKPASKAKDNGGGKRLGRPPGKTSTKKSQATKTATKAKAAPKPKAKAPSKSKKKNPLAVASAKAPRTRGGGTSKGKRKNPLAA